MDELIEFATSRYVVPLLLFAHGQAVNFTVSKVKEAASKGTSETALFLVNNFWTPRVADKITLPVVLVCPAYLFSTIGGVSAAIAWAATYAAAFAFALYMRKLSALGANRHFMYSIVLTPVGYGLALYWALSVFFAGGGQPINLSDAVLKTTPAQFTFPPWEEIQAASDTHGAPSAGQQSTTKLNAGECDSAVRVVTVAMAIGLVAVGKDQETQSKAITLTKDMEVVLQRSCGLTPEHSHRIVQSILRDVASGLTDGLPERR